MAIESFWFDCVNGYAENSTGYWTHDVEIAPSTVSGMASLASFETSDGGAFAGFSQYRTRNLQTGIDSVHALGNTNSPDSVGQGVAPEFFDQNVDSVTLWYEIWDGNNYTYAYASWNLFFWG